MLMKHIVVVLNAILIKLQLIIFGSLSTPFVGSVDLLLLFGFASTLELYGAANFG